ncbi:MAG: S8 family serine peptidase, partial [Gemmatimonadales bacterium]
MPRLRSSVGSSALVLFLVISGLVPLWRSVAPDAGPVIAVIDTGVDARHPDLGGRLVPGRDFFEEDDDPADTNGHGTQVAGLALAVAGADGRPLCPSCRVMPLRVARGSIVQQDLVARAIEYAVERRADVILVAAAGVHGSAALRDAVTAADAAGIPIVAPAGQGFLTQTWAPASDPRVVSVVALDSAAALHFTSNTTGYEDVAEIADHLQAPVPGGGREPISGSSAAAARVAGVAGALREADPALDGARLRRVLAATASPLGPGTVDRSLRFGVLDPAAALDLVRGAPERAVRLRDLAVRRIGGASGRLVV